MKLAMVAKELAVNVFSTRSRWQRKLCLTTNLYLSEQSVDLGSDGRSEEGLRLDLRLFGPKLFQSENIYKMFLTSFHAIRLTGLWKLFSLSPLFEKLFCLSLAFNY